MSSASLTKREAVDKYKSMQTFGEIFIEALPAHIKSLKIPGRSLSEDSRRGPLLAHVEQIGEIQNVMDEVLCHRIVMPFS